MRIELWPLSKIRPYSRNPRVNDGAVDAVAASLKEFGFRQPIVVDDQGVIIAGHTRWKAAQKLGLAKVPVHVAKDLTPEQIKAYRIADNQTATIAEWDFDLLPIELADLKAANFDLGLLGFSLDELAELLDPGLKQGLTDPDDVPEPPDEATTRPGDLIVLGDHRLLCGDSSKAEDVDRLLDGAKVHLVNTDPPYNVKVEPRSNNAIAAGLSSFTNDGAAKRLRAGQGNAAFDIARGKTKMPGTLHHQGLDLARHPAKAKPTGRKLRAKDRPLVNDFVSDEAFGQMLHAWFGNISRVLELGRGFYIWGGYANCANYPPVLKANSLYFSQAVIWVKEHPVLTRKDFMGNHEWCQPADTLVATPDGAVPIQSLVDGDRVVSYSRHGNAIIGRRHGPQIARTSRPYSGDLLGVVVDGGMVTHCTPNHFWTARLTEDAGRLWCTYLMRRGRWWRVGKSMLLSSWGFGLKQRLYVEGGEEAWILSTHGTSMEAAVEEQFLLAKYGIPTLTWAADHHRKGLRQIDDVARVYDRLDLDAMEANAHRLLAEHGRHPGCPILTANRDRVKVSRRVPHRIRACNLLAGAMAVPVPLQDGRVRWAQITEVDRQPFAGEVYSMEVEKYHHYIADGIVTSNCFYGWKEGAAHQWLGPTNAVDVWSIKKVNPQSMIHLTEKPVELATRAMQYSSRAGENVLDLFGGSGSTLIAAEQTGRRAFLMEIDPLYSDVIVQRWEQFTGRKAKRTSSKRS